MESSRLGREVLLPQFDCSIEQQLHGVFFSPSFPCLCSSRILYLNNTLTVFSLGALSTVGFPNRVPMYDCKSDDTLKNVLCSLQGSTENYRVELA